MPWEVASRRPSAETTRAWRAPAVLRTKSTSSQSSCRPSMVPAAVTTSPRRSGARDRPRRPGRQGPRSRRPPPWPPGGWPGSGTGRPWPRRRRAVARRPWSLAAPAPAHDGAARGPGGPAAPAATATARRPPAPPRPAANRVRWRRLGGRGRVRRRRSGGRGRVRRGVAPGALGRGAVDSPRRPLRHRATLPFRGPRHPGVVRLRRARGALHPRRPRRARRTRHARRALHAWWALHARGGAWTRSDRGGRAAIGEIGSPSRSPGDGSHQPDQSASSPAGLPPPLPGGCWSPCPAGSLGAVPDPVLGAGRGRVLVAVAGVAVAAVAVAVAARPGFRPRVVGQVDPPLGPRASSGGAGRAGRRRGRPSRRPRRPA